jgi:2-polyprenyl-6-methoxyphenol hydroxylase-like FAD-dependent oxidoreductase
MDYDVIVVGARVAGSALATLLGQLGHRVLLLEKAHFPSDTLSTHFFRDPALRVFERIGVLDEVKSTAPPLTTVWNYIDGQVFSDPVNTSYEHLQFFLCVRRITLDWILAQRVGREPGVEFRQGAHVKELIWQDGRVTGVRWSEADGMREARTLVVVGADGLYSTLAKSLTPAFESQIPVRRCMYYTYFQGIKPLNETSYAEHHFMGDSLTYVFPTDADLTLVALSLPISEFLSFKKEALKQLHAHLDSLPLLAPRLRHAEVAGEVKGAGNIPCYQRVPYGPAGVVGDSHQVLDPWSGMGIDHATTHASILADSLHSYLSETVAWEMAMRDYHTQARQWSEKTYRRTSTYAADLRPMTRAALQKRGLK